MFLIELGFVETRAITRNQSRQTSGNNFSQHAEFDGAMKFEKESVDPFDQV